MLARIVFNSLRPSVNVGAQRAISVQSLLHGSPEAKQEGELEIKQHSRRVGRGKYIHGFEVHHVKPDSVEEYKKAAEAYYVGLKEDPETRVKLTGNWEVIIGEQDTFYHVLEYENYAGFDKAWARILNSEHAKAHAALAPYLRSRSTQLNQEFAFLPTAPPHTEGGIFEMRTYQLNPGTLLEWEGAWRRGIDARRKFVEPVGAWYAQVGRLHQVHHLWQYPDLATRKEMREQAWQLDGWADTVSKTSQLAKFMDSYLMVPLSFSPLK
ncbi:NIPSNAP-domain-containing protein [Stereum hirsutum FP-91666 SS1]|uniref:NIPSNAP-domain-containing protein n=1 Tax=Stereum hirsutum (strain FP-91666) TaxID=721885 RepID=UPI000440F889|nr:NIPSNAP-domain-containing protein [Stereum hirsutum FP-91666 SS1]EIM92323.1 NIPSNAP-domain-containing protein [Stereum hirsutum FP-91666 SS1]